MKVNFVSDLHLDSHVFVGETLEQLLNGPLSPETYEKMKDFFHMIRPWEMGEILLIGGDLSNFNHTAIAFLKYTVELYGEGKVVIVTGNHDLYIFDRVNFQHYDGNSFNRLREFKDACEKIGVILLDGEAVTINGVKIAGCGMWYDNFFAESKYAMDEGMARFRWSKYMNDYTHIRVKGENSIRAIGYNGGYTLNYLKYAEVLRERLSQVYGGARIILTHIAPTFVHFNGHYANVPESTFYQFDGAKFLNVPDERIWIFGHTHDRHDFRVKNTRLLCEPIGYKGEFKFGKRLGARKIGSFKVEPVLI